MAKRKTSWPSLSRDEVNRWAFRIYRYLLNKRYQVLCRKKIVDEGVECWGLWIPLVTNPRKDKILLSVGTKRNYRISFFRTIIHECLHGLSPDMPHNKVYRLTTQLTQKMSSVQYAHLMIVIGKNLERHYHSRKKHNK